MTEPQFLTTRILWQFVTKDELHKQIIEKASKTATTCARKHPETNDLISIGT
jgi:hypothetical protein